MMKGTKNLLINRRCVGIATCVIAGLLQACMPFALGKYGPDDQSREEFEQRVEAVFRLQNRMTSEVMVMQEGDMSAKDQEAILQAEQLMEKNCGYLNEYVSRDIDGLSKGLFLQRHVEKSVLDCETAAHNVEVLLKAR
jgi:galactokinase/mevalonate kinase-like predicted kinase